MRLPLALGVGWRWEIRKSSKPANYNDEGDTAISKFLMGTKSINYHSIGFSVGTKSKLCDTKSYDGTSEFSLVALDISHKGWVISLRSDLLNAFRLIQGYIL